MVAVQAVIHIDAVAVEMEVKDAGLAVRMKRDDVLRIGEAARRPAELLLSGQPDHVVLQGTTLELFLPEFLVQLHISIDGLWAGILREVVQFYHLCFSLTGYVPEGHAAVGDIYNFILR